MTDEGSLGAFVVHIIKGGPADVSGIRVGRDFYVDFPCGLSNLTLSQLPY